MTARAAGRALGGAVAAVTGVRQRCPQAAAPPMAASLPPSLQSSSRPSREGMRGGSASGRRPRPSVDNLRTLVTARRIKRSLFRADCQRQPLVTSLDHTNHPCCWLPV
jgi:hypothetical protein